MLGVAGWERAGRVDRSMDNEGEWRRFMAPVGEDVETGDIVMAAI